MNRWTLSAAVLLAVAAVAPAQTFTPGSMPDLSKVTYAPVDTGANIAAPVNGATHEFNFGSFFRSLLAPTARPTIGASNYPAPSTFKSTKYPNFFQPRKPVIPQQ